MAEKGEFIVKLDGIKLTAEQLARVNGAIQGAVMAELGKFDFAGDRYAHIPRREWYGIYIRERLFDRAIPNPVLKW